VAEETSAAGVLTVLVVDDQPIVREGLAGMLRDAGYVVFEASDGEYAIEIASSARPELVVMDLLMPGISGIEAAERIVTQNPATRVLMLADTDSAETVRAAIKAGVASYLTKAVATRDFLLDALRRTVAGERVFAPAGLVDALVHDPTQVPPSGEVRLTSREREIITLAAEGAANSAIATALGLSSRTVENHLARMYKKLGVTSRTQLARVAADKQIDRYPWAGQVGTIVLVDIAAFAAPARSARDQMTLREAVYEILRDAFDRSGIPWSASFVEDRGDGMLIIVPPGVPISALIDPCLTVLAENLANYNSSTIESANMQLRIALHAGPVTTDALGVSGEAIIHAARLIEASTFRGGLQVSGADLGVIVSELVYNTVIRQGNLNLVPADLQSADIQVKDQRTTAWMWFSEYKPSPGSRLSGPEMASPAPLRTVAKSSQRSETAFPERVDSAPSVNVYVDGFNLYYGCLQGTQYQWLDIGALCRRLVPGNRINRIRYFTSRVAARPGAPNGPQQQDAYLRALSTIDRLSIHLGNFRSFRAALPVADPKVSGPRIVEAITTREKGSDVNLATYLLLDSFQEDSDIAVVVSNDSDLAAPIRVLIQELGQPVGLVNPHPVKQRSRALLSLKPLFFKQLRPRVLRDCQFPAVLEDNVGLIRRPDGW
jgi:DNA-binding NarL/FixJ family response regulator